MLAHKPTYTLLVDAVAHRLADLRGHSTTAVTPFVSLLRSPNRFDDLGLLHATLRPLALGCSK
jgi:hypothetical protein